MLWLRKSKKGFTLIELMVVVAIIAVLSLLGLRVYTAQATKAKNASVQANVHSLATEIGIIILEQASPTYSASTVENAADNTQIVNPFDTSEKGNLVVFEGATAPVPKAGFIEYSNTGGNAYQLVGYDGDSSVLITTNVNYKE